MTTGERYPAMIIARVRAMAARTAGGWRRAAGHRGVARTALGAAALVVALAGIYVGLLAAGDTHADIGPFAARLSVTPSMSGGTDVQIPPLGSLGLASHDGPAHLTVRLDTLDQARTFALATDPDGLAGAGQGAAGDLRKGMTALAERSVVAGLLGTLVLSTIVFRRWRRVLLSCGVAAGVLAATGAIGAGSFRPSSIEEPTYSGLLANAPR